MKDFSHLSHLQGWLHSLVQAMQELEDSSCEGFLMQMVEQHTRNNALLDLHRDKQELMSNIITKVSTATVWMWGCTPNWIQASIAHSLELRQMASWLYWEECGQQVKQVDHYICYHTNKKDKRHFLSCFSLVVPLWESSKAVLNPN